LAILHLAREGLISLEQNGYFSDIIIKKRNHE
jgi:chromatin segregation and condensation protein Rec8/ScpA/Scc1 (kleisin family)